MAQLFLMPQLGSTMEEGTILKWLKQEGDLLRQGEVLLEIETDKASMEVEVTADGVLRKILVPEAAVVPIRGPIAIIAGADESIESLLAEAGLGSGSPPAASLPETETAAASQPAGDKPAVAAPEPSRTSGGRVFMSPRARRLADEQGLPTAALAGRGSGPDGRVVESDVRAYLADRKPGQLSAEPSLADRPAPRTTPLAARIAGDLGIDLHELATGLPGSRVRSEDVLRHREETASRGSDAGASDRPATAPPAADAFTAQPFGGMRKRIADNVVKSAFTAPHVTLTLEVDMTACAELRSQILADFEKAYGVRVSYTDILIKAVARGLGEHPLLNASLVGDALRLYTRKNIGVAVALEEGLIVPVVKDADGKSLGAVSVELKQLVERSRTGKFTPDDLTGGTFTITNLGAFGIDVFDPILVTGQAAILGVGRIADKPVVRNKEIVIRTMMNLCLSFDHRILDGAPAARFLQRLKELLENPVLMLI